VVGTVTHSPDFKSEPLTKAERDVLVAGNEGSVFPDKTRRAYEATCVALEAQLAETREMFRLASMKAQEHLNRAEAAERRAAEAEERAAKLGELVSELLGWTRPHAGFCQADVYHNTECACGLGPLLNRAHAAMARDAALGGKS
jgi:hypothetical protein